jgi:hypothetical protein
MHRVLSLALFALVVGCGDHDHDVTDPTCQRIESACVSGRNPAQTNCHDLAHANNSAMCAARLNECLATCGADASTPGG